MNNQNKHSNFLTGVRRLALLLVLGFLATTAGADDAENSESKALDSTATQWSFQLA